MDNHKRASWAPFFDDGTISLLFYLRLPITPIVHAILFLAPLSFNRTLEEDNRVNRLVSHQPDAHLTFTDLVSLGG